MSEKIVKVHVDRELLPLHPETEKLKTAFEIYKTLSLSLNSTHFAAPTIGFQRKNRSAHIAFGRDTEFENPPELINDILDYQLCKVHLDTRGEWSEHTPQWHCTSNESIVYSGLETDTHYHYIIIDFLISAAPEFDSHNNYQYEDIDSYLDIADENHRSILDDHDS